MCCLHSRHFGLLDTDLSKLPGFDFGVLQFGFELLNLLSNLLIWGFPSQELEANFHPIFFVEKFVNLFFGTQRSGY